MLIFNSKQKTKKGKFMNQRKDIASEDEIDLRELFRIFIKRKWWFIGTFIVVLIAGLLFTFLRTPEYTSTSMLRISNDYLLDSINKYFPKEAYELRIGSLSDVSIELKLSETLNEVDKALDYDIDKDDLSKAINISIDKEKEVLMVTTVYSDPEIAYRINKTLLDVYKSKKNLEFNETYNKLVQKIETKFASIQEEVDKLSTEAEECMIDFNFKIINKLEKSGSNMYFSGVNYIPPVILNKLNSKYLVYNDLEKINSNLLENKEFIIDKVEILEKPEIPIVVVDSNYKRNVIVSLFTAIIVGFMVVFAVNYFASSKNKNI